MNDYGEIIELPYKAKDIYEIIKKLLKYDKIKHISLQTMDEESMLFHLVFKTLLRKANVSIKLSEPKIGMVELSIYADTRRPLDFNGNRKIVRKLVNIIFKELEQYEKTSSDDFSVSILEKKDSFKSFLNFITVAFLAFLAFYFMFTSFDSIASRSDDSSGRNIAFIAAAIFFGLIYSILYKIIRKIKRKIYSKKRITKIKKILYHLIEEKPIKKDKINNSVSKDSIKEIGVIPNKDKPYLEKSINYINKVRKEKPKFFWIFAISIGILITWSILGALSNSTNIEGVFVQDLSGYKGKCAAIPDEITFKNGIAYGSGAESTYLDGKYEYKVKGNKIYIIIKGKEVFSELTIKNKNTLIYGDGVLDEQYYGSTVKVCGVNGDGVYRKK